jgi:hypothetical protein
VNWLSRFGRFWYDFIVGDDWTIAAAVVVAVAGAYALAHSGRTAWPIVPLGVVATLTVSLYRAR